MSVVAPVRPASFVHRFEPGTDPAAPPLLLLHGTGGDENDLVGIARLVAPGSALLAPRGRVTEGGGPRFFRRVDGDGALAEVERRAAELAAFVGEARRARGLGAPVALAFSSGAGIAAALMLLHPGVLAAAALLRPLLPLPHPPVADLAGTPVLLVAGAGDGVVPRDDTARLAGLLQEAGARLETHLLPGGHALGHRDLQLADDWIATLRAGG